MNHAHIETIDIAGGLTDDATGDFATVGDALIERGDGELIELFVHAPARGLLVLAAVTLSSEDCRL